VLASEERGRKSPATGAGCGTYSEAPRIGAPDAGTSLRIAVMTQQIAGEVIQHPWVTVITSWLGSGALSALVAGLYGLRAKRSDYVNDYYKAIIKRRITAYERLENTIVSLKASVADPADDRLYHSPFSSENEEDWNRNVVSLTSVMSEGLWLSDEAFDELRELNLILFHSKKPVSVVEFGKNNYQRIATLRANLERILARDMLYLHDVKRFLKSKDKSDPGFRKVKLKR